MVYRLSCWGFQGGETLAVQRRQLEELYSVHSGSLSILMEADGDSVLHHKPDFPEGPANFTLLWSGNQHADRWMWALAWARLRPSLQRANSRLSHLSLCVSSRRFGPGSREKVLRWLCPKAELGLWLDSAGGAVQRCLVTHSTSARSKVSSHQRAEKNGSIFLFLFLK